MFTDAMRHTILKVTLISGTGRSRQLSEAMALILEILTFEHVPIGCCEFSLAGELSGLENSLVA